jgi:hypothetical protein
LFWHLSSGTPESVKDSKDAIIRFFQADGHVVSELVEKLYQRNEKPVRLTLKSSPKDGYVIDVDGKYAKYFEENGGGWDKLYKENPKAKGITTISLPVYDHKTGLVLIYVGTQLHSLMGGGGVILYGYKKGKLKKINYLTLWNS